MAIRPEAGMGPGQKGEGALPYLRTGDRLFFRAVFRAGLVGTRPPCAGFKGAGAGAGPEQRPAFPHAV